MAKWPLHRRAGGKPAQSAVLWKYLNLNHVLTTLVGRLDHNILVTELFVLGYSSLLYGLETTSDFRAFNRALRKLWKALDNDMELPQKLVR